MTRTCRFCHHAWFPRKLAPPKQCPRCQRVYVEGAVTEAGAKTQRVYDGWRVEEESE